MSSKIQQSKTTKDSSSSSNINDSLELYKNTKKLKFLYLYTPQEVPRRLIGLSIKTLLNLFSLIYLFRTWIISRRSLEKSNKIDPFDLLLNIICIITSILLFLMIKLEKYILAFIVYNLQAIEYFTRLIMSINFIYIQSKSGKLDSKNMITIIIGLSTGTFINFMSVWLSFSYLVYLSNIKNNNKNK